MVHPIYVGSLFILIVNDVYLKYTFTSALTGKLSDVTGLFCFTIFLYTIFHKRKNDHKAFGKSALLAGGIFTLIQFPFVVEGIDAFLISNHLPQTNLTPDVTDLFVLILFPVFALFIRQNMGFELKKSVQIHEIATVTILSVSMLWFVATSFPTRSIVSDTNKSYVLNKSEALVLFEFENFLEENEFEIYDREILDDSTYIYNAESRIDLERDSSFSYNRRIDWRIMLGVETTPLMLHIDSVSLGNLRPDLPKSKVDSLVKHKLEFPFEAYAKRKNLFKE